MFKRIVSGAVGLVLLILLVYFRNAGYVLNIALSLLSALAIFEIFQCVKIKSVAALAICIIFSVYIQFSADLEPFVATETVIIIFAVALLILMVLDFKNLKFPQISMAFTSSLAIPFAFLTLNRINGFAYAGLSPLSAAGLYYLILVFVCSWMTDSGAYFVGSFLGKHKLTPEISPKKTVEGAVGGILVCIAAALLCTFIFNQWIFEGNKASYLTAGIMALILAPIGMLGDLAASVIKRNYDVKDFGNIMPGHGGVMDRFDSILFVAPVMYVLILFIRP